MTFGRVVETNFEHTGYSKLFLHGNSIYLESPKEHSKFGCVIITQKMIIKWVYLAHSKVGTCPLEWHTYMCAVSTRNRTV